MVSYFTHMQKTSHQFLRIINTEKGVKTGTHTNKSTKSIHSGKVSPYKYISIHCMVATSIFFVSMIFTI